MFAIKIYYVHLEKILKKIIRLVEMIEERIDYILLSPSNNFLVNFHFNRVIRQ